MSYNRLAKLLSTLLLLVVLSACGVLEVGLEPTPEPGVDGDQPTPLPSPTLQVTPTGAGAQDPTDVPAEPTEEVVETPTLPAEATETVEPTSEPTEEPTSEPAETPAPQPEMLRVAYVKEDNAYLWTPGAGEAQLTDGGGVQDVDISDDGQLVAFIRDGHLWVVDSQGGNERQLTTDEDFAGIDLSNFQGNILGVRVYQTGWIPGTHSLLFNTSPQLEGPGLLLTDDLWRVDADSGELTMLSSAGEGGTFVLSPDGNQVALVTPDSIHAMNVDGSDVRDLLNYEPVLTYSEYQYYAQPVWTPDGNSLRVVIPPVDPLGQPAQPTEIWHLAADGSEPQLMGQVVAFMAQNNNNVAIAPDTSRLAFLEETEAGGGARNLMIAMLNDQVSEPNVYTEGVNEIRGWSPDSTRLIFASASGNTLTLSLGAPPAPPEAIGGGEAPVIDLQWADDEQFVFTQQAGEDWELVLGDIEGQTQSVAVIAGQPPGFDVDK